MAINETIVTGRKFRKLIDEASKKWQRISFWTKSSDVEFDDGKSAETKVGAIDGITDSLVSTSSRIAASAKAINTLNQNLSECKVLTEGSGANTKYYIQKGADAVSKKLLGRGEAEITYLGPMPYTVTEDYGDCMVLTFVHLTAASSKISTKNLTGSFEEVQKIAANDGGTLNSLTILRYTGLNAGTVIDASNANAKRIFLIRSKN